MKVKYIREGARILAPAKEGDAGYDICTPERVVIKAGERVQIPTGVCIEMEGFINQVAIVKDKSGLATKHGITNLGGVIDEGYRGEIVICSYNTSDVDYVFEAGDKIAQIILLPYIVEHVNIVDELSDSQRGQTGFGSTGK